MKNNKFIALVIFAAIILLGCITTNAQTYQVTQVSKEFYNNEGQLIKSEPQYLYNKIEFTDSLGINLEAKFTNGKTKVFKYHIMDFVCDSELSNDGYVKYSKDLDDNGQKLFIFVEKGSMKPVHFGVYYTKGKVYKRHVIENNSITNNYVFKPALNEESRTH